MKFLATPLIKGIGPSMSSLVWFSVVKLLFTGQVVIIPSHAEPSQHSVESPCEQGIRLYNCVWSHAFSF